MYGAEEKWDLLLLFLNSSAWVLLIYVLQNYFLSSVLIQNFLLPQLPISSSQDEYILLCQPALLPTTEGAQSDGAANSFRNPPFYDRLGRHSRGGKREEGPRGAPTRGGKQDTQMFITTKQPTDRVTGRGKGKARYKMNTPTMAHQM